jgi:aryl-alcohol dehydrogenase-like predicted oxidoreductase
MHRLNVSLLAYSPLAFGLLTGKYDESGTTGPDTPREARIAKLRIGAQAALGPAEALVAARRYNALARENGLTPTRMALAFCYTKWQVASTIIGVTTLAQLDEDLDAWGTTLSPELLAAIDKIRWEMRDPAVKLQGHGKKAHVSETPATQLLRANTRSPSPSIPTSTWSTAARSTAPRCWA